MGLFKCRGCEARDKEIQHLLAELNAQREHTSRIARQLCEVMSPGSSQRSIATPKPPAPKPAPAAPLQRPTFPGYERPRDVEFAVEVS